MYSRFYPITMLSKLLMACPVQRLISITIATNPYFFRIDTTSYPTKCPYEWAPKYPNNGYHII